MKYDWLRDYEDQDLEPMELSASERERVLQNALGKLAADGQPSGRGEPGAAPVQTARKGKKRRFARFCGILAAALAVGLLTAGAVGIVDTGQMLYQIFGSHVDPEIIDALGITGYPIGLSQTQGGYTVTLQGMIGDRKSCYLVFDVTAPEGTVLEDMPYGFAIAGMEVDYGIWNRSCGYYLAPLEDKDPTDDTISFLFGYDGASTLPGRECRIDLQTFLTYVDDHSGDGAWDNEKIIADETWSFTFQMDYQDVSRKVPVRQPVSYNGSGARLTSIYVSPLSLQLEYGQSIGEWLFAQPAEALDGQDGAASLPAIVLHFRDGSEFAVGVDADGATYGVSSTGSGSSSSSGISGVTKAHVNYSFDRLIDTAELVSLEIDGVLFPIS